jgi:hypothetical protein
MKKQLLILTVVCGLVPAAFAGRNFSGIWGLSHQSLLASVDTVLSGAALITVNMTANKLTLICERPRIVEEYIMDGEERPIATRFGSMTYATSWEGDTLVITRTPVKKSSTKAQTLRFSISANMRYLQITCTLEGDKDPQDVLSWERR